jgi:hypothetical protein
MQGVESTSRLRSDRVLQTDSKLHLIRPRWIVIRHRPQPFNAISLVVRQDQSRCPPDAHIWSHLWGASRSCRTWHDGRDTACHSSASYHNVGLQDLPTDSFCRMHDIVRHYCWPQKAVNLWPALSKIEYIVHISTWVHGNNCEIRPCGQSV